ncbi:hypothetical protein ACPPVT_14980 [Angustibacter sp. McL0619]|uniref:hypothetical protein n=1 Tax=Angustibacter sp. McL0619 TaxID=3415676 RepID=UPI003CEDCF5A
MQRRRITWGRVTSSDSSDTDALAAPILSDPSDTPPVLVLDSTPSSSVSMVWRLVGWRALDA